jgi:hypothetical protein
VCNYLGCNSDQECADSTGNPDSLCLPNAVLGYGLCGEGCDSVADCGTGVGAYGEDNYECVDSGCVYTGCNSNDECVESHGVGWDCV